MDSNERIQELEEMVQQAALYGQSLLVSRDQLQEELNSCRLKCQELEQARSQLQKQVTKLEKQLVKFGLEPSRIEDETPSYSEGEDGEPEHMHNVHEAEIEFSKRVSMARLLNENQDLAVKVVDLEREKLRLEAQLEEQNSLSRASHSFCASSSQARRSTTDSTPVEPGDTEENATSSVPLQSHASNGAHQANEDAVAELARLLDIEQTKVVALEFKEQTRLAELASFDAEHSLATALATREMRELLEESQELRRAPGTALQEELRDALAEASANAARHEALRGLEQELRQDLRKALDTVDLLEQGAEDGRRDKEALRRAGCEEASMVQELSNACRAEAAARAELFAEVQRLRADRPVRAEAASPSTLPPWLLGQRDLGHAKNALESLRCRMDLEDDRLQQQLRRFAQVLKG